MKLAAESATRYAVGASALAALAVSAFLIGRSQREVVEDKVFVEVECERARAPGSLRLGELVVVGTPDYERVNEEVIAHLDEIESCFRTTSESRLAIYAHAIDGVVDDVTVLGNAGPFNLVAVDCIVRVTEMMRFTVRDNMDLMIPIALE